MPPSRLLTRTLNFPKEVTVTLQSRVITVTGPRGKLERNFTHLDLDLVLGKNDDGTQFMKADLWFGKKKQCASLRTICSHVDNMVTGVTKGFLYKMRFVYAHFPVNAVIDPKGSKIEIRNFLGEKRVRKIAMLGDTQIKRSDDVKDQLILSGNDIDLVSRSAALIHQSCLVKKKDIRKFLDGCYVESKGNVIED
mmetsp:Transcript_31426/g.38018  ORF Transcript_31426/g.38018 Transcript_31426/m.38018 type:complete len:194 (+) Transcript_31426:72-653(+)|eukprot:CAMPEP_0197844756 /NCGR_PEP_ID=MMETSP1438-20131217/1720_1 /TAXON_ID=1461541 /ORGANISM="Pterosperma sp., Strain CCMP1384" /LENGTH=193 /DNA_ID=CAMNT_0043455715 /DNA_START=175 /DNA_END=756 /DNA_ORIENTATION=-